MKTTKILTSAMLLVFATSATSAHTTAFIDENVSIISVDAIQEQVAIDNSSSTDLGVEAYDEIKLANFCRNGCNSFPSSWSIWSWGVPRPRPTKPSGWGWGRR